MASRYSQALGEPFTAELIEQFGGPKELLSCLESLSQKLHRILEDASEGAENDEGEPPAGQSSVLLAGDHPLLHAMMRQLLTSGADEAPADLEPMDLFCERTLDLALRDVPADPSQWN